jgi:hypothetical protein
MNTTSSNDNAINFSCVSMSRSDLKKVLYALSAGIDAMITIAKEDRLHRVNYSDPVADIKSAHAAFSTINDAFTQSGKEPFAWLMTTPESKTQIIIKDKDEAMRFKEMDSRSVLPIFTSQPNSDLIQSDLVKSLQWYIDNDDVIESQEGNEYWVDGKRAAEKAIARTNADNSVQLVTDFQVVPKEKKQKSPRTVLDDILDQI